MQLQREHNPALNAITAYGEGYVTVNQTRYEQSVYFAPEGPVVPLGVQSAHELDAGHLKRLAGLDTQARDPMAFLDDAPPSRPDDAPEVVLIGTGQRQHFLNPVLSQELLRLGIGVEIMDTQAAARTYNILMAEGRRVVVALLIQETS